VALELTGTLLEVRVGERDVLVELINFHRVLDA
jgi:hypothetical protein